MDRTIIKVLFNVDSVASLVQNNVVDKVLILNILIYKKYTLYQF